MSPTTTATDAQARRRRSRASRTKSHPAAAAKPTEGRYIVRSASITPLMKKTLDTGEMVIHEPHHAEPHGAGGVASLVMAGRRQATSAPTRIRSARTSPTRLALCQAREIGMTLGE